MPIWPFEYLKSGPYLKGAGSPKKRNYQKTEANPDFQLAQIGAVAEVRKHVLVQRAHGQRAAVLGPLRHRPSRALHFALHQHQGSAVAWRYSRLPHKSGPSPAAAFIVATVALNQTAESVAKLP